MRFIRAMLDRLVRPDGIVVDASASRPLPARLPAHEKRQLAEAQVRIPQKWKAFDEMVADYAEGTALLSGRRE